MDKLKTAIPYIKKHKWEYILGLFTLLVVDYCSLLIPQITGEVTDGLATYGLGINGVLHLLFELMGVVVLVALGRIGWRMFILGASRKIETEIRNDLFHKLEELSPTYFNAHKTGDLMTNFTNDIEALRNSLGMSIISTFDAFVMTFMTLYKMMVYVNYQLTFITIIPMSIIAVGGYFFGVTFEKRFLAKQQSFGLLSDQVQESVTGERVIKAFVQEDLQDQAFEKVNSYNRKKNIDVVKLMATVFPLLEFVIGVSYVIAIVYGGRLAITGQITLGRFVAFNSYIGILVWPMIALGDSISSFSQGIAAMERLGQIFNEVPDIKDEEVKDIDHLNGNISIENLSFKYADDLPDALKNVNVEIKQGETFAILGRTGSGKTTLVNLLMRLYDINEGSIRFDGNQIREIPLKVLRENISYVPQDNYMFSDTIENNIRFGKRGSTHEDVVEACEEACVHDNIIDFEKGYETIVGERGVTLSGGQKQRCSIARALLKDAPILILDDSLSAVDTDTEDKILENLKKKRQNKTTIMIAHRISTVKNADHILVLEDGKPIEYGTQDELMALNGVYKEMYDKQQLEKQLQE